MTFETVIGLEIHVELETESKIFCSCSTKFGSQANENTCPVCLGLPGSLPVLNESVVDLAIKAGRALGCTIGQVNKTDRKNYFYPDLPKAYQISQADLPICTGGGIEIEVDGQKKFIELTRIHMEEDAGKLIHHEKDDTTLVDYNRAGVPLIEIVTEPVMRSPQEALIFLRELKSILEYAQVSDCKMEQGSLRCDGNISIRQVGSDVLNTKVEIKNLNSFKEIQKALLKEEKRQKELYRFGEGHKIKQETRKWDAAKGRTIPMRSKENAHDYRFFPDPDLPPVYISDQAIKIIEDGIPELPQAKSARFISDYHLDKRTVHVLTGEKNLADFFETLVEEGLDPKKASNWIQGEIMRSMKRLNTKDIPITAHGLIQLIQLVDSSYISNSAAKEVYKFMLTSDEPPKTIVHQLGLKLEVDHGLTDQLIQETIDNHPQSVIDYRAGKIKSIGYLVGMAMKASKGSADPKILNDKFIEYLK